MSQTLFIPTTTIAVRRKLGASEEKALLQALEKDVILKIIRKAGVFWMLAGVEKEM
jgi:hypothetical protein